MGDPTLIARIETYLKTGEILPPPTLEEKIAYMNINKCGGGSRSKDNELEEYAKTYKEYIEKEIKIINPDLIVCGSSIVHNIVGGIVERKNDRPYLVEVYHPSYYRISDKEYLKRFYNELKNIQNN